MIKLGVKEENIHFSKYIVDDKKVTKEISISTIKEYMSLYPNASVHTFYNGNYSKNNHVDHIAIGEGAKALYNEGVIKELYMHVEPYAYEDFIKTNQGGSLYKYYPWNKEQEENIVTALKEYCIWEPKSGKLAVGYHSVKSYFDEAIKNPVNYIMVLR